MGIQCFWKSSKDKNQPNKQTGYRQTGEDIGERNGRVTLREMRYLLEKRMPSLAAAEIFKLLLKKKKKNYEYIFKKFSLDN